MIRGAWDQNQSQNNREQSTGGHNTSLDENVREDMENREAFKKIRMRFLRILSILPEVWNY